MNSSRHVAVALGFALGTAATTLAWTPLAVTNDPLVRMPGTQPGQLQYVLDSGCITCHGDYDLPVEPLHNWEGGMMAQAGRDPLFWACMTVAEQDSIWAIGRPNAGDLCIRCHSPKGWLEGRSDPVNGSALTGNDFDGVGCHFCHEMVDPLFEATYNGTREGNQWSNYWDETNLSATPSSSAANTTRTADIAVAQQLRFLNGQGFYGTNNLPAATNYQVGAGGQYFVAMQSTAAKLRRASFADASPKSHDVQYSRYHKSKYFCATCHDVSNPVLANLGQSGTGTNRLTSESQSAHTYFHVERTFSEFMLSAYGQQGGAAGSGHFNPATFKTSQPGNLIASCQDCHMPDAIGRAASQNSAVTRPTDSIEHPKSGQPVHDLTGGNIWVPTILASTVVGSPNYNATNASLLVNKAATLTMDITQGIPLDPSALLAAAGRAATNLLRAASITNLTLNGHTGQFSFRIVNHTGHKLISGFPEGRRMFVNVRAYQGTNLFHEINPYDHTMSTLKGLDPEHYTNSPPLGPNESHADALVYEVHPESDLTGEEKTFHFALATGRSKDNRIPPRGFRIGEAAARIAEPVWDGAVDTNYFTTAEYAGGYDELTVTLPSGTTRAEVRLYYQTTSREYIEFLRDEINGTRPSLTSPGAGGDPAYLVQTDPFFAKLKAWGDTIWNLWYNNRHQPGAAPVLMTSAQATSVVSVTAYTLAVTSPYGNPSPAGITTNLAGSTITATVAAVASYDTTQFVNTGWTMTGHAPASGTTNWVVLSFTNNAALAWLWKTQVQLSVASEGHGLVEGALEWYDLGSSAELTAVASNGHAFAGWSGDVPAADTNHNPLTLLMDRARTVTAHFVPILYSITASAGPGGSISPTGTVVVNQGGDAAYSITPDDHFHIDDVLVDGSTVGPVSSYTFTNVTADHTIAANFAIDRHTLAVISAHGSMTPYGVTTNAYGTVITGSVDAVVADGTTQFVNTGWSLAGNAPASGDTNVVVITVTNDAVLTWSWATNYWLALSAGPHGRVDTESGWFAANSTVPVLATASNHFEFSQWSGDVPPGHLLDNPLAVLMDGPKVIAAVFVESLATNGVPAWWLALYYPGATNMDEMAESDTDLDGIMAWAEYIAGTVPTDAASVFVVKDMAHDGAVITWPSVSGRLYSIFYATDLMSGFAPFADAVELPATPDVNAYTNTTATNVPMLMYRIDVKTEQP